MWYIGGACHGVKIDENNHKLPVNSRLGGLGAGTQSGPSSISPWQVRFEAPILCTEQRYVQVGGNGRGWVCPEEEGGIQDIGGSVSSVVEAVRLGHI